MEYTKYRWLMGDEKHFSAATASQFLTGLRSTQMQSRTDDAAFMRDIAMLATDWTGKPVQYTNIPSLRRDLLRSGAIAVEESNARAQ